MDFTCRFCSGTGVTTEKKLSPFHRAIIKAVRTRRSIAEKDLIAVVYRDRPRPAYPNFAVQGAIRQINRRMKGAKIVARTNRYHPADGRRYQLSRTDGGDHADGTDHRGVRRGNNNGAADISAAARETE